MKKFRNGILVGILLITPIAVFGAPNGFGSVHAEGVLSQIHERIAEHKIALEEKLEELRELREAQCARLEERHRLSQLPPFCNNISNDNPPSEEPEPEPTSDPDPTPEPEPDPTPEPNPEPSPAAAPDLATDGNLLQNPHFDLSTANQNPVAWTLIVEGDMNAMAYGYINEPDGRGSFARVSFDRDGAGEIFWQSAFIPVKKSGTYVFQDIYRSDVPTEIGIKFKTADGNTRYDRIEYCRSGIAVSVPPSDSEWRGESDGEWQTSLQFGFTVPTDAVEMSVFHVLQQKGGIDVSSVSLTEWTPEADFHNCD